MKLRETLAFARGMAVAGYQLWVDPPMDFKGLKLEVDRDWEAQREAARVDYVERYGPDKPLPLNVGIPKWPLKVIPLRYMHPMYKQWTSAAICINQETREIDFHRFTSGHLLGRVHKGSAAIGVAIFSLPTSILASPLIAASQWRYNRLEKRSGMSRHGYALVMALKGQLDEETRQLLVAALRNTWQKERQ